MNISSIRNALRDLVFKCVSPPITETDTGVMLTQYGEQRILTHALSVSANVCCYFFNYTIKALIVQ